MMESLVGTLRAALFAAHGITLSRRTEARLRQLAEELEDEARSESRKAVQRRRWAERRFQTGQALLE